MMSTVRSCSRRTRNIVVLGSSMVGKTAMCVRFANDRFDESYEPTYENSFSRVFHHDGRDVDIYIKDTQGLADQDIFRNEYGLGYHGYVLVYSVASSRSLEIVKGINSKLINLIGTKNVPRVLVGNKSDLANENLRQVSIATGQALADKWGCAFVEASAKFNFHIDQVFASLLDEIDKSTEPEASVSAASRCIDILSCCHTDPDALHDQARWEKWLQVIIGTILTLGIVAIVAGIVIGIRTAEHEGELVAYVLFGFGVMVSLVSGIGLYGVAHSSAEFLRVYAISLTILFITQIVVWLLLYQNIELFQRYALISLCTTAVALVPQGVSICLVYCFQTLLTSITVGSDFGSLNSYHTLYE